MRRFRISIRLLEPSLIARRPGTSHDTDALLITLSEGELEVAVLVGIARPIPASVHEVEPVDIGGSRYWD